MIYPAIKIFARFALKIFCSEIAVHDKKLLDTSGPLLITANHPNSFLDAIIIGASFKYPVHFLARGDAFRKPWHRTLLNLLNMIPIYRLSEGKENLHLNKVTFDLSKKILSEGGIVLIFIEGISDHEYGMRSFKKGAGRIALDCSQSGIPVKVLPLGINYSDFRKVGVFVEMNIGRLLTAEEVFTEKDEAKNLLSFNDKVKQSLEPLVWKENKYSKQKPNYWLLPFAIPGWILNVPFYYPVKNFVAGKTKGTIFYHAVLVGILYFGYPVYVLLIFLLLILAGLNFCLALSAFILFPLTAYLTVQVKE